MQHNNPNEQQDNQPASEIHQIFQFIFFKLV